MRKTTSYCGSGQTERIGETLYEHPNLGASPHLFNNPDSSKVPLTNRKDFCHNMTESGCSGIGTYDTIRMGGDCLLSNIRDLDSWNVTTQPGTRGREIQSAHKVIRTENSTIGLSFKPPGSLKHHKKSNRHFGMVTVNIPAPAQLLHGRETMEVLTPDQVVSFQDLTCEILSDELAVDPLQMKVSRLDPSTRYKTDAPVAAVVDLMAALTPSKMGHRTRTHYPGQTIQFSDKSRAFGFYDSGIKYGNPSGGNYTRCESQLKNSKAVKSAIMGGPTARPLLFSNLADPVVMAQAVRIRAKDFDKFFPDPSEHEVTRAINALSDSVAYWIEQEEVNRISQGQRGYYDFDLRVLWMALQRQGINLNILTTVYQQHGMDQRRVKRAMKRFAGITVNTQEIRDVYHEIKTLIYNDLKAVA